MIRLRGANGAADSAYFFELRNDPIVARASRRAMITREEHERWWTNTTDFRWIALEGGRAVGTLRLGTDGTVSIIVAPDKRGQGVGSEMLRLLAEKAQPLGFDRLWAEIAPENRASQRCFLAADWAPVLMEKILSP